MSAGDFVAPDSSRQFLSPGQTAAQMRFGHGPSEPCGNAVDGSKLTAEREFPHAARPDAADKCGRLGKFRNEKNGPTPAGHGDRQARQVCEACAHREAEPHVGSANGPASRVHDAGARVRREGKRDMRRRGVSLD